MPFAAPIQSNFSAGEISPLVQGRPDFDAYKRGLGTCRNWLTTLQGALIRRPVSQYVATVANTANATRLERFVFIATQSFVLEFGNQTLRFYTQEAQIQSGGSPYQISTPYLSADLFNLRFAQSNDVLYIVHPNYQPMSLNRFGNTNWTLTNLAFTNGPFLPENLTAITLHTSATSGSVTVTASTGIFNTTDVGRWIGMNVSGSQWSFMLITAVATNVSVTATIATLYPNASTSTTTTWMLGIWSNTTGWPACVCFHQGRLGFGGATADPVRFDLSVSQSYLEFTPFPANGNVTDSNAVSDDILSQQVNQILWMVSNSQGLQIGTLEGEWLVTGAGGSSGNAITPSNFDIQQQSSFGSLPTVAPVAVGRATLYAQRAGRKIREMYYQYILQGFDSQDITVLSEHITASGVKEMAFQEEPIPILWAALNNGTLVGCTYEHDIQQLRVGWHEHVLGGVSSAGGDNAVVESVCVIPTTTAYPFNTGVQDELWMVVRRYVNGATVRHVEFLKPSYQLDQFSLLRSSFYLDCHQQLANTYDIIGTNHASPAQVTVRPPVSTYVAGNVVTIDGVYGTAGLNGKIFQVQTVDTGTITGATAANPVVITAVAHPFTNGEQVYITGVVGMTQLNGNVYTVASTTTRILSSWLELTEVDSRRTARAAR